MANLEVIWERPTTRESGRPLNPADIAGYAFEASHDGGEFGRFVDSPANAVSRVIENIAPGDWVFNLRCFDSRNKMGQPATGSISIPDDTPPGVVLNLTLRIAGSLATTQG